MCLRAKLASAATAARGFGGYLLRLLGADLQLRPWLAAGAVALFTVLVLTGIRRSSGLNILIVSITLLALGSFIVFGLPGAIDHSSANLVPILPVEEDGGVSAFLYATALMFVAYTCYARIATLGQEVTNPKSKEHTAALKS